MRELEERLVKYHKAAGLVGAVVYLMFVPADYWVSTTLGEFWQALALRLLTAAYLAGVFLWADRVPPKHHHWLYPITLSVVAASLSAITIILREPLYLVGMLLVFFGGSGLVVDEPRWTFTNVAVLVLFGFVPPLVLLGPSMDPKFLKLMLLYDAGSVVLGLAVNAVVWRNSKELVLEKERSARLEESERAARALAEKAEALVKGASKMRDASDAVRRAVGSLAGELVRLAGFAERVSRSAAEVAEATGEIAEGTSQIDALASQTHGEVLEAVAKEGEAQRLRRCLFDLAEELGDNFRQLAAAAFQVQALARRTRILSVNAGVEAARSGEPALVVVAEQIKNLAEEVRGATGALASKVKGLGNLVEEILRTLSVYGGVTSEAVAKVSKMEEMAAEVLGQTARLASSAKGIDDAARVQAQSSEEVAEALAGLQKAAERLEALAEELTQAAEELESASA